MKHIHKYVKILLGRKNDYVLYKCIKSGCFHNMQPALMIGIEAECYDCGEVFTINGKNDLIEKLKCVDCRKGPEVNEDEILSILEEVDNEDV